MFLICDARSLCCTLLRCRGWPPGGCNAAALPNCLLLPTYLRDLLGRRCLLLILFPSPPPDLLRIHMLLSSGGWDRGCRRGRRSYWGCGCSLGGGNCDCRGCLGGKWSCRLRLLGGGNGDGRLWHLGGANWDCGCRRGWRRSYRLSLLGGGRNWDWDCRGYRILHLGGWWSCRPRLLEGGNWDGWLWLLGGGNWDCGFSCGLGPGWRGEEEELRWLQQAQAPWRRRRRMGKLDLRLLRLQVLSSWRWAE